MEQLDLFELIYPRYFLPKKPRIFEAFAGIGCQRLAFKKLSVEVESVGISEIDKFAIQSYQAIHGSVKNFGDISNIKGQDLPNIDVFTYSFPCTDLSKAGKQQGLIGTRSGLVYEVIRILKECKESDNLPRLLIMENVVDLVSKKFIRHFQEIQTEIEKLGYLNYTSVLNAKNYGVAQTRERVFMISIMGEYAYKFPKSKKLEKTLKDYLEDIVDKKYLLSEKMILTLQDNANRNGYIRSEKFKPHFLNSKYAFAIKTSGGHKNMDNFIVVKTKNKVGYSIGQDGDGINMDRPHQKNGVIQKQISPTLKTQKQIGRFVKGEIRRLTPLESWRLMGIDDEDFWKAKKSGISDTQLYKQAGNGIVVDVFASLLEPMIEKLVE